MAIGLLDDYSFGWSDLVALCLIVGPVATLLAVHVTGGAMSMRSQCHGRASVLRVSVWSWPPSWQIPTMVLLVVGLSHQSRRDTLSHHQNDPVR